jgi:4a-hydroxytetrahydrobiopterin dehydratase
MDALSLRSCSPCESGTPALSPESAARLLAEVQGWAIRDGELVRDFRFKNYDQTTAFVHAAAGIAHREDHHPDITFGYKTCSIRYLTHSIGGLSENDFICAAKVNALLD